jgi:dolichol-phosphate mannosyltransferase
VADDSSPDGTAAAVREVMAARHHRGRVDLLLRSEKAGRGAAVIAAFKKGLSDPRGYTAFVEMDADFSHHPKELPKLLEKLEECDMVVGSRYVEGGGT